MDLSLTLFEVQVHFAPAQSYPEDDEEGNFDPEDALLSSMDEEGWCQVEGYFRASCAQQAIEMATFASGFSNVSTWCDWMTATGDVSCTVQAREVGRMPVEPDY